MKLRTVGPKGSVNSDAEFDLTIEDEDGVPYDPTVIIRCRTISVQERRAIRREATVTRDGPRGKGKVLEVDDDLAAELMVVAAVVSWNDAIKDRTGEHPVPCTDETKSELPLHVKAQIIRAAANTEETASAESFRKLTSVV